MNQKEECRAALLALDEQIRNQPYGAPVTQLRTKHMLTNLEHALECLDKLTVARAGARRGDRRTMRKIRATDVKEDM